MLYTKHSPYLINGRSVLCGRYDHLHLQVSKLGLSACPGSQLVNAGPRFEPWFITKGHALLIVFLLFIIHINGPFMSSLFPGGKYQWYLSQISMINIRGIIPVSTLILSQSPELMHHFRGPRICST